MGRRLIFSSFIIKIAALIFMTMDHVGLALISFLPYDIDLIKVSNILRGFGRLALPLFIFMIVEGVIHTKNIKKYFLRLGIMASIITTFLIVITYVNFGINVNAIKGAGNIFLDLLLVSISVFLLKQDNKYLKILILLPLAIGVSSFMTKCYEYATGNSVLWYPNWLYLQYDWVSIALGVGFYLAYKAADLYINNSNYDKSIWDANGNYRFLVNIISIFIIVFVFIIHYLFRYIWPKGTYWNATSQLTAICSSAFILLYNGKRGYNAKWFQYGSYLYYIVHLAIIVLIFTLITGGI